MNRNPTQIKAPTRSVAQLARHICPAELTRLAQMVAERPDAKSYTSTSETTGQARVIYADEARWLLTVSGVAA